MRPITSTTFLHHVNLRHVDLPENQMKTTALASALLVAALGVAPLTVAHAGTIELNPVLHVGANLPSPKYVQYPGTMKVHVDATDLAHRVFDVHETIPVKPGSSIYLLYPQWIPGIHQPFSAIKSVAGLVIKGSNGKRIQWKRSKYDVRAFQVDVPEGVTSLDVRFKFLSSQGRGQGPIRMTPEMLEFRWDQVSLYPAGYFTNKIKTVASVTLPTGWKHASALEVASHQGNTYTFKPVSYMTLVDSPLRSEERRVGKECRCRWSWEWETKQIKQVMVRAV